MKERFKSPVVWAAVLAQAAIIVSLFLPDISENVKIVGTCIIEVFTLFGILNNPSDCNSF